MGGDARATRARLLEAARREFAAYGIAGARVDRIADAAGRNKAQIYQYFDSKDGLFDAVLAALVDDTLRDVPMDATDLPEYAGRLFDNYSDRPEVQRLATWYRLERADSEAPLEVVLNSLRGKIAAIAEAQRAGLVSTRYSPIEVLGLVVHLASLWTAMQPELAVTLEETDRVRRRQVVTDAVTAVLAR